jgi:UDP-2,3-diacylglucosamine hydrolase
MELIAPSRWQCADFISDLHLQAADRPTFAAWAAYMRATDADAVFILGDLFEVWVGDDAATSPGSFEAECVAVLREAGQRLALFIMQGNRDFLMGPQLMQACAATALPDPTVFQFAGQGWLLSHGDELCVDDVEYQLFRKQVRSATWQQEFLVKPLAERQAIALGIRQTSAARKGDPSIYADVDTTAALSWLDHHGAEHLIHGHTHKPAQHPLDGKRLRTVLSDWDVNATPSRAEVLRITAQEGLQATPLRLAAASLTRAPG